MQDEKNVGPGITEDIRKLLKDKEVIHVIKGSLDENAIRNNILIHTYQHEFSGSSVFLD